MSRGRQRTRRTQRRGVSRLRIAGIALLVGLALGAGALVWNQWRAREAFEQAVDQLAASGAPVTPEAMTALYPPVDGPNAAPLYLEAAALLDAAGPSEDVAWMGAGIRPGGALSPEQSAASAAFLNDHAEARALLAEAATRDTCRFPFDPAAYYRADLQHLTDLRNPLRFLMLDAVLAVEESRSADATQPIAEGLLLTRRVLDEPVLLARLVADGMTLLTLDTMNHGIRRRVFEPGDLAALDESLDLLRARPGLGRVLVYERAVFVNGALEAPKGHAGLLRMLHRLSGILYRDLLHGVTLYGDLIAIAELPDPAARYAGAESFASTLDAIPGQYVISRMALANAERWVELDLQHGILVDCMNVALAADAHRQRTGRLPRSLSELVPGGLDAPPVDPVTGSPLVYRVEQHGFAVYSVGDNGVDDAGELLQNMGEGWRTADYGFRVAYGRTDETGAPTADADAPASD